MINNKIRINVKQVKNTDKIISINDAIYDGCASSPPIRAVTTHVADRYSKVRRKCKVRKIKK